MFDVQSKTISSYLGWWADAGLTDPVAEEACDWLAAPAPVPVRVPVRSETVAHDGLATAPVRAEPARIGGGVAGVAGNGAAPSLPETLPSTLTEFDAWLADYADLPGAHWSAKRCMPIGPAGAPLMIIADCPDVDDLDTGQLFSGANGRLLDAMLGAIGFDRAALRVASIALTRPPAGRIDSETVVPLRRMMLHHIALAKPQRILVLGQQTNQIVCETIIAPDGHGQQDINHFGGITTAYAVHHPRLLLERPMLKRAAWVTLKRIKDHG